MDEWEQLAGRKRAAGRPDTEQRPRLPGEPEGGRLLVEQRLHQHRAELDRVRRQLHGDRERGGPAPTAGDLISTGIDVKGNFSPTVDLSAVALIGDATLNVEDPNGDLNLLPQSRDNPSGGAFSGGGNLAKIGAGSLDYPATQGKDTFTGLVTAAAGTIKLGTSKKVSSLSVTSGVFDINTQTIPIDSGFISGEVDGSGTLQAAGPDGLTLNGSGFGGSLEALDGGLLTVDGEYGSSATTVDSPNPFDGHGGGTLTGIGSVGDLTVQDGATVSPGLFGLSVNGGITLGQNSGSTPATLAIEVDGSNSGDFGRLVGSGGNTPINLNNVALSVTSNGAATPGQALTIIQGSKPTGKFTNVAWTACTRPTGPSTWLTTPPTG